MTATTKKPKSKGLALLISFFLAGIGEVYLGEVKRGILIFAVAIIIGIVSGWIFGLLFGNTLLVATLGLGYWIWQMWDTHRVYKKLYPQVQ